MCKNSAGDVWPGTGHPGVSCPLPLDLLWFSAMGSGVRKVSLMRSGNYTSLWIRELIVRI